MPSRANPVRVMNLTSLEPHRCGGTGRTVLRVAQSIKDDGQAQDIFSRCRVKGFAFDVEVLYLARRLGYQARGCRLPGLPSPKAESIRSRTPCGCCWMLHSFACRLVGLAIEVIRDRRVAPAPEP